MCRLVIPVSLLSSRRTHHNRWMSTTMSCNSTRVTWLYRRMSYRGPCTLEILVFLAQRCAGGLRAHHHAWSIQKLLNLFLDGQAYTWPWTRWFNRAGWACATLPTHFIVLSMRFPRSVTWARRGLDPKPCSLVRVLYAANLNCGTRGPQREKSNVSVVDLPTLESVYLCHELATAAGHGGRLRGCRSKFWTLCTPGESPVTRR